MYNDNIQSINVTHYDQPQAAALASPRKSKAFTSHRNSDYGERDAHHGNKEYANRVREYISPQKRVRLTEFQKRLKMTAEEVQTQQKLQGIQKILMQTE